ncbi:hypothetical protein IJ425_08530 [bacterium]|nr:hypothetical protein [bacterium]
MSIFEQILNTNVINFLIVISTLVLIFRKAHLGDLIEKMAQDVKSQVEKSSIDAQNALGEYKATKKAVKDTPKIQEEIIATAKSNAQILKEKIEEKTKSQEEEIKCNIEKIFASQSEKAKKLTIKEIYNACVDLAQEEVIKRLNNETHKRIIQSSIDELDKIEGSLS